MARHGEGDLAAGGRGGVGERGRYNEGAGGHGQDVLDETVDIERVVGFVVVTISASDSRCERTHGTIIQKRAKIERRVLVWGRTL